MEGRLRAAFFPSSCRASKLDEFIAPGWHRKTPGTLRTPRLNPRGAGIFLAARVHHPISPHLLCDASPRRDGSSRSRWGGLGRVASVPNDALATIFWSCKPTAQRRCTVRGAHVPGAKAAVLMQRFRRVCARAPLDFGELAGGGDRLHGPELATARRSIRLGAAEPGRREPIRMLTQDACVSWIVSLLDAADASAVKLSLAEAELIWRPSAIRLARRLAAPP